MFAGSCPPCAPQNAARDPRDDFGSQTLWERVRVVRINLILYSY